jgi:hypothetical protein
MIPLASEPTLTQHPPQDRARPGPGLGALIGLVIGSVPWATLVLWLTFNRRFLEAAEENLRYLPVLIVGLAGGVLLAAVGAFIGWVGRWPEAAGLASGVLLCGGLATTFAVLTMRPQSDGFTSLIVVGVGWGFLNGLACGVVQRVAGVLGVVARKRAASFLAGCAASGAFIGFLLGEVFRRIISEQ